MPHKKGGGMLVHVFMALGALVLLLVLWQKYKELPVTRHLVTLAQMTQFHQPAPPLTGSTASHNGTTSQGPSIQAHFTFKP